jgi:hypothetical protein
MFDIGDKVWVARWAKDKQWETCPHCLGNEYLTVIMGDGKQVTTACACCAEGIGKSSGKIAKWDYVPSADEVVLDGYEVKTTKGKRETTYRSGCCGFDNVFATKEEALAFALAKIEQERAEDKRRMEYNKEKAEKTWAWNATYHIDQIQHFEDQIKYHKSKLAVAESHVKKQEVK